MCTTESTKWEVGKFLGGLVVMIPGFLTGMAWVQPLVRGTDMGQATIYGPKIVREGGSSKYNFKFWKD